MESRPDFLGMNMEEATNHWNLNYIFDFLYHVRSLPDIDLAINWLAEKWADTHHIYDTYYNIKNPKLVEEHQRFVLSLKDIKDSLLRCFEAEERKEALRVQMLMGKSCRKRIHLRRNQMRQTPHISRNPILQVFQNITSKTCLKMYGKFLLLPMMRRIRYL